MVVVRKKKTEKFGIWTLAALVLAIAIVCTVWSQQYILLLVFFPWILLSLCVLLYYETWKICFFADRIQTSVFIFHSRNYSYNSIIDAVKSYSFTDRSYVTIIFNNGCRIRFRLEDQNANKAVRKIQSHHSLRSTRRTGDGS